MPKPSSKIPFAVANRAKQIKVFLMDVDGTLTTGTVTLASQPDGSALEIKTFDAHDGQGLSLAHAAGLRTGVITGRESAAMRRRARELNIEFVYEKQPHKIARALRLRDFRVHPNAAPLKLSRPALIVPLVNISAFIRTRPH